MADKDAIRRASALAEAQLERLDAQIASQLRSAYADAVEYLGRRMLELAGSGSLELTVLDPLLAAANARLALLNTQFGNQLNEGLALAALMGASAWASEVATLGTSVNALADAALAFTVQFQAADGLQLSDRIWRLENGAKEVLEATIRRHVVLGSDASQAALELLSGNVPASVRLNGVEAVSGAVQKALLTGKGSAYDNALRVMRTELNRAHGEAYQIGAAKHPDVAGMRFLLSPRHPRPDVCDMHAAANLWGLGRGVYPVGQAPWPAHPRTFSYLEAVFNDEVSDADRRAKETPTAWLKQQPSALQDQILGKSKAAALRMGVLSDADIYTKWADLQPKFAVLGFKFD